MIYVVSARGADLHCLVRGDGALCLMLSSVGAVPYERMLLPALAGRCRVAVVDPRGAGASTGEADDLTWSVLVDDLEAVRKALGAPRVVVMAHSLMGALAIEYARLSPQTVAGVVVVGCPPTGDLAATERAAQAFFRQDADDERMAVWQANWAALAGAPMLGQAMIADTPRRFFDPRADASGWYAGAVLRPAFLRHLLGPLTRPWSVNLMTTRLQTPLLVLHGRCDYVVPASLWDPFLPELPTAQRQVLERSAHHPFVDEPAAFGECVGAFMSRVCAYPKQDRNRSRNARLTGIVSPDDISAR